MRVGLDQDGGRAGSDKGLDPGIQYSKGKATRIS